MNLITSLRPYFLLILLLSLIACSSSSDSEPSQNVAAAGTTAETPAAEENEVVPDPQTSISLQQDASKVYASVENPQQDVIYLWHFGDGNQATGQSAENHYAAAGQYLITLTTTLDAEPIDSQVIEISESPVTRIVTLGDSITQGDRSLQSYRYELWKHFIDAGVSVDFVGSLQNNHGGNPDFAPYLQQQFDQDHEGHYGWSSAEILIGRGSEGNLAQWLSQYQADVALIHLGTNDILHGFRADLDDVENNLTDIIALLRENNPQIKIAIAEIIPLFRSFNSESPSNKNVQIADLNERTKALAKTLSTSQSPIISVDHFTGFLREYTQDSIHPNTAGERFMAQTWYNAIADWF